MFKYFEFIQDPIAAVLPLVIWSVVVAAVVSYFGKARLSVFEGIFYSLFGGFFGFLLAKTGDQTLGQMVTSGISVISFFALSLLKRKDGTMLTNAEKDLYFVGSIALLTLLVFYGYFSNDRIL